MRKRAKDAGVDLAALTGTGPAGEVTRRDLAQHLVGTGGLPEVAPTTSPGAPEGDETWTIPLKGVRRATAQAMVASAFTAPHVTEFLDVDVTRTMELVARSRGAPGSPPPGRALARYVLGPAPDSGAQRLAAG